MDALERHVLAGDRLHADDTPVPVHAPGTGRLWATLRHVLGCIADHPVNRVSELLPWNIDMDQGSTAAA